MTLTSGIAAVEEIIAKLLTCAYQSIKLPTRCFQPLSVPMSKEPRKSYFGQTLIQF
ncbi:hypothetical protein DPMN_029726 [Dreissena polymorpha]|uniref:Uncharacterized protein n=1 Tax=Dreissena polymorpha TaxID=45954 RepID=A0A9D4LZM5_DREPO|nr:hypothetical protein DPMN_029726 [Dreissena polymorpha]